MAFPLGPSPRILSCALALGLSSLLPAPAAEFRNFKLPCLAPLLRQLDSEAPASVSLAFLRGPTSAPQLRKDIGTIDFPITTESSEAAAFFNQGVALIHGLSNAEAERSFRQALVLDPDNPMIFWGLSVANEQRPQRARLFAQNAVRRVKNQTTLRERKYISTLGDFYHIRRDGPAKLPPPEKLTAQQLRERHRQRIRNLELITLSFPDDLEAKALLLRQLTLDKYRSGIPLTSHVAVDQLARKVAELAPAHPSLHYRIFLWLDERPAFALSPAERSSSLAPGIPDSWRYAAEARRANGLYHHAIPLLESAVRVHHRHMAERFLMPEGCENLTSNYAALIGALASAGRVNDALQWSQRLLSLPRSLDSNGPTAGSSELILTGRRLMVESLLRAERTGILLNELEDNEFLQADPASARERALALYWKCAALALLDRDDEIGLFSKQLGALANSPASADERKEFSELVAGLQSLRSLCKGMASDKSAPHPPHIPLNVWARAWSQAGQKTHALDLARQHYRDRSGDLFATAAFCELSFESQQSVAAMSAFTRRFREDAMRADKGLPALVRLAPLAAQLQLPKRWQLPAKNPETPGLPVKLSALGPANWTPPKAPAWSLSNHAGRTVSLADYNGRTVLLNFFLGVSCPYCLTQLDRFRPHLDEFKKAGVSMIAISTDTTDILGKRFGRKEEKSAETRKLFPYPVLADPKLTAFKSYGVFDDFEDGPMHATFLIGPDRRILWSDVGHEPFNHPEVLLKEARRLLNLHASNTEGR